MAEKCPYCGAAITTSLKFCVTCRRSVTEDKIRQLGAAADDSEILRGSFKLSKKDHEAQRAVRTFFFSMSTVLMLVLVFVCSMKFLVRKPIPGEKELQEMIRHMGK